MKTVEAFQLRSNEGFNEMMRKKKQAHWLIYFNVLELDLLQSVMAGDYILAVASRMLARLQNDQVIILLSQV